MCATVHVFPLFKHGTKLKWWIKIDRKVAASNIALEMIGSRAYLSSASLAVHIGASHSFALSSMTIWNCLFGGPALDHQRLPWIDRSIIRFIFCFHGLFYSVGAKHFFEFYTAKQCRRRDGIIMYYVCGVRIICIVHIKQKPQKHGYLHGIDKYCLWLFSSPSASLFSFGHSRLCSCLCVCVVVVVECLVFCRFAL